MFSVDFATNSIVPDADIFLRYNKLVGVVARSIQEQFDNPTIVKRNLLDVAMSFYEVQVQLQIEENNYSKVVAIDIDAYYKRIVSIVRRDR